MKTIHNPEVAAKLSDAKVRAVVSAAQEHMTKEHDVFMTEAQVIALLDNLERVMSEMLLREMLESFFNDLRLRVSDVELRGKGH